MEGGRAVEQEIFILCAHTSRMAGGQWLGGLYDTFLTQELLFFYHSNMLGHKLFAFHIPNSGFAARPLAHHRLL